MVLLLVIFQFRKETRKLVCLTMMKIRMKVLLSLRGNSGILWFVLRRSVKLHVIKLVMAGAGQLQTLRLKWVECTACQKRNKRNAKPRWFSPEKIPKDRDYRDNLRINGEDNNKHNLKKNRLRTYWCAWIFRAWWRMICWFEDFCEVFSKGKEKCRLTQRRAVCYVYGEFIYSMFLSKESIYR